MFLPRRYLQQRPLRPRTRARQSQSKPSSSFCVIPILLDPLLLALTLRLSRKLIRSKPSTLCARGPCVSKCREPTTPKRDVTGPRTILLVAAAQITLTAFSDEIQDFRRTGRQRMAEKRYSNI